MNPIHKIQSTLPDLCLIVAVSKKQSVEKILHLYKDGQRDFAENYSQELIEKQFQLRDLIDLRWHFIGQIQKNKLKHIVGAVEYIHSVGSFELAELIHQQAKKKGIIQKIFLQLNLAHEPTKNGWTRDRLLHSIELLKEFENIKIVGLMTLPPLLDNPELLRPYFRELKSLMLEVQDQIKTCCELSMGTSRDYLIAAEEGATMVRLGTLVFGDRT